MWLRLNTAVYQTSCCMILESVTSTDMWALLYAPAQGCHTRVNPFGSCCQESDVCHATATCTVAHRNPTMHMRCKLSTPWCYPWPSWVALVKSGVRVYVAEAAGVLNTGFLTPLLVVSSFHNKRSYPRRVWSLLCTRLATDILLSPQTCSTRQQSPCQACECMLGASQWLPNIIEQVLF